MSRKLKVIYPKKTLATQLSCKILSIKKKTKLNYFFSNGWVFNWGAYPFFIYIGILFTIPYEQTYQNVVNSILEIKSYERKKKDIILLLLRSHVIHIISFDE